MKYLVSAAIVLLSCQAANAVTFGAVVVKSPVTVGRIYQGYGATYVRFLGTTLTGCSANGGYLRPSWAAATVGGVVDHERTNRMLSVLLMAKAQDLSLEVRYRVNSDGTGWNRCSIDGVYLF